MIQEVYLTYDQTKQLPEIIKWCTEAFGNGTKSRFSFINQYKIGWGYHNTDMCTSIFFRNDKYYSWFLIRWM